MYKNAITRINFATFTLFQVSSLKSRNRTYRRIYTNKSLNIANDLFSLRRRCVKQFLHSIIVFN